MFYIVLLEFLVRSHPMPVSLGYIQFFFPHEEPSPEYGGDGGGGGGE